MCYVPKCFVPYASVLCAMHLEVLCTLCQCPMCYVFKCYRLCLCPMPPLAHLARCKKLWAEKEPSVKLPGGGKVCHKNTNTHIHMYIRQFKHTSASAQTQSSSHWAQFWTTEVWRSQVVPRAVSFRSNSVMSGKILPKSQKPRKTHFWTHNILAFPSPSHRKDKKAKQRLEKKVGIRVML